MKIMSYVFRQISSSIKLRPEKITAGKKGTVLVLLASVLECHHISYVEKWKLWDIYLLTLNKKWKMKIMGKVARLILVVAVSVCVVSCVLCCFQNNPVFSSVTIFHILKNENYELCFLANFFVHQITTGKNYKRKKRYCVSFFGECSRMSPYFIFWKMKIMSYVFRQVSSLMKLWPEKITTGKKGYAKSEPVQLCGCVGFFVVVPAKSELPPKQFAGKLCGASSRQIWAASKTIFRKIIWKLWREFTPHYFAEDCFGIDFF